MNRFNKILNAVYNDPAGADKILSKDVLDIRNSCGETFLHYFAVERSNDLVKVVLDKGVDVNALDSGAQTPLMESAMLGYSDTVALLLEYGADPNYQVRGENALRCAIAREYYEVADILIKAGANINQRNPEGETILFDAVRMENIRMIEYILANGGKGGLKNMFKETVADIALENESYIICALLKKA